MGKDFSRNRVITRPDIMSGLRSSQKRFARADSSYFGQSTGRDMSPLLEAVVLFATDS